MSPPLFLRHHSFEIRLTFLVTVYLPHDPGVPFELKSATLTSVVFGAQKSYKTCHTDPDTGRTEKFEVEVSGPNTVEGIRPWFEGTGT